MNLLLDPLPVQVSIGGTDWPINTDFRFGILFELMMQDPEVPEELRVPKALALFYPQIPTDLSSALEWAIWFYRCGKEEGTAGSGRAEGAKQGYSFEEDGEYIYAAFREAYGVDLNTAQLHWWAFRAMFRGLPEGCQFCKIMGYRTMDLKGLPKGQKKHYERLQRLYALKKTGDVGAALTLAERDQRMKDYVARRLSQAG